MKHLFAIHLLLALLAFCGVAQAQVDLAALDHGMAGKRTEVLVLGTAHLSNAPKGFKLASLQPLLQKLQTFKPDMIAIENISGEDCALMKQYSTIYIPENVSPFCSGTDAAKAATGLDQQAAVVATHAALKAWPAHPTAAQHRHLAALFLASGERASAMVQWLQLPGSERHSGDGLNDALVANMNERLGYANESYSIAARLAARLGEPRVYPIDDHTGDNIAIPKQQEDAFAHAIRTAWASSKPRLQAWRTREHDLLAHNKILPLYRFLNQPKNQQLVIEGDMGAALRDGMPPYYGHMYVTGWEARNLRMASNILAIFREHPGAHVLVIVGATHKPWLDKILGQLPGLEMANAEKVLGQGR